jgi:HEAT repeat protein
LWKVTGKPKASVPVLIGALKENKYIQSNPGATDGRILAARILSQMGTDAKEAVPALIERLHSAERNLAREAGEALKKIDPQEADRHGIH